ncbi:MAG: PGN_0703 family putative restriction endonuclease [Candidatus Thorarchaeota archaeon]
MNYREAERQRMIDIREDVFRDPGEGVYRDSKPEVLKNASLNLWEGIREDAFNYFEKYQISWWAGGVGKRVTGHLLSSQVACLNHLYFLRQRKDVATAILRNICPEIIEAVVVDDGLVEFEVIGSQNFLGERSHSTRGAFGTSIDAVMVGKKQDGMNILVMIEWKYTEDPKKKDEYKPARAKVYDPLLAESDCPIQVQKFESLYYEPFYQLMRQTLLGWKMVQSHEYNCDEYIHLHIIPSENKQLKEKVTSPNLEGDTMSEAWCNVLRDPSRYQVITPEDFLLPIKKCQDTIAILSYLNRRYWRDLYDIYAIHEHGHVTKNKVYVTGKIEGMNRREVKKFIESEGYEWSSSISSNFSMLILGDNPEEHKVKKAEKLGIEMLTWDEFVSDHPTDST